MACRVCHIIDAAAYAACAGDGIHASAGGTGDDWQQPGQVKLSSTQSVKTLVWEILGSIDSRWYLERCVDAAVVVVSNVPVDGLDHLANGLEAIEVA
jgi:hypothetical protein